MSENQNENRGNIAQTWVISLAVSVFCCALFFAFLSTYVGAISQTLTKIDERLANIELREAMAQPPSTPVPAPAAAQAQPPLGPFPTVIPPGTEIPTKAGVEPAAPAPVPAEPAANAPATQPIAVDTPSVAPPAAVPAPESATPNLPPVPENAVPVEAVPAEKK